MQARYLLVHDVTFISLQSVERRLTLRDWATGLRWGLPSLKAKASVWKGAAGEAMVIVLARDVLVE